MALHFTPPLRGCELHRGGVGWHGNRHTDPGKGAVIRTDDWLARAHWSIHPAPFPVQNQPPGEGEPMLLWDSPARIPPGFYSSVHKWYKGLLKRRRRSGTRRSVSQFCKFASGYTVA